MASTPVLYIGVFRERTDHGTSAPHRELQRVEILHPRYPSTGPWIAGYPAKLEAGEWLEILPAHGQHS